MTDSRCKFAIVVLPTLLAGSLWAAEPFSSLEEHMTVSEFRESGLHKLTDEELAALNRWIRSQAMTLADQHDEEIDHDVKPETEPATAHDERETVRDTRGLPADSDDRPIHSRIVGTFTGWHGDTEFELENGMVWRQAERDSFSVREMHNPQVEIRPGMFGSWRLSVEGYNRRVRVERIR